MRPLIAGLTVAAVLAACGGIEVRRGLPVAYKPSTGRLISGSAGPADIARGNQARLEGRHDDAVRDLKPLAERGYPQAMLFLAASHASIGTAESQATAVGWYRAALRQRPDAQVPLARALMETRDERNIGEAEQLLTAVLQQGENISAEAALLRLYRLYPSAEREAASSALAARAARSPTNALRLAAIDLYRDRVIDSASAKRLVALCDANIAIAPGCHIDLVRYYRILRDKTALADQVPAALLAFSKLAPAVEPDALGLPVVSPALLAGRLASTLVALPDDEDRALQSEQMREQQAAEARLRDPAAEQAAPVRPGQKPLVSFASAGVTATTIQAAVETPPDAEPELANQVLRWMLPRGGDMPLEAAGVAVAFPYLLPDIDLEAILVKAVAEGRPRAPLALGELYFFNQRIPRNPQLAEKYFKIAADTRITEVTGNYRLGRLYQSGYLGRPEPDKALKHLLFAARHGSVVADRQLARMFYDTPGVRTDRVNAYVFARLATESGYPVLIRSLRGGVLSSTPLLDRLTQELTATELQKAIALHAQEQQLHMLPSRAITTSPVATAMADMARVESASTTTTPSTEPDSAP